MQSNRSNRIYQIATILILALLVLGQSACGQRGPLYLPGDRDKARTDAQIKQDEQVRRENSSNRQ